MADKFEKGEIAIYIRPGSEHYGEEVEIMSNLQWFEVTRNVYTGKVNYDGQYCYLISIRSPQPPHDYLASPPEWLKKKRSPAREWFDEEIDVRTFKEKMEA